MFTTKLRAVIFIACWLVCHVASAADETASATNGDSAPESKSASKHMVALELWMVTLKVPKDMVEEDRIGPVLARVKNMPMSIGTRDNAQKLLDHLEDQGAIERQQTFRVSTVSGSKATFVAGERVAAIVGSTLSDRGQTNNIQYQQIGTALNLTPTVQSEDKIWVDVSYERSELEKSDEVALALPASGTPIYADNMPSLTVNTRARLTSGEAALIALASDRAEKNSNLIILYATIVD